MARGLGISPLVDDPNERTAHALVNQSHELVAQRVLKQMQVMRRNGTFALGQAQSAGHLGGTDHDQLTDRSTDTYI